MDAQIDQPRKKPGPKKPPRAVSEVVSFRIPLREYDELAAEARKSKTLIGDLARDKFRAGQTFQGVVDELSAQKDAVDGLRAELGEQLAAGVAAISVQVRAAMREQAIQSAIEEGIARGVATVMKRLYREGESPSERKLREMAEAKARGN